MRFASQSPNSISQPGKHQMESLQYKILVNHREQPENLTGLTGVTLAEARAVLNKCIIMMERGVRTPRSFLLTNASKCNEVG